MKDFPQHPRKDLQKRSGLISTHDMPYSGNDATDEGKKWLFDNLEWFNCEEAANYLRVSVGALRNMTSNGQVPCYKLMRRVRYKKSELESLLIKKGDSLWD